MLALPCCMANAAFFYPCSASAATPLLPFVWVVGLTRRMVVAIVDWAANIHGNVSWLALHHDASFGHYAYRLV